MTTAPHPTSTPLSTSTRPAYEDLASPAQMHADCRAAGRRLGLADAAHRATRPAPSLQFENQPREQRKPVVEIPEATARLAAALHLHLD